MALTAGAAAAVEYRHGDLVQLPALRSEPATLTSFLGGAQGRIESSAPDSTPPNGDGWAFSTLGGPTTVRVDAQRGRVLFTPEDPQNYNAVRRFDPGFVIAEQRYVYKAHWVRNVLLLDGVRYTKSYQWKHERLSWQDSVSDTNCELKVHNWPTSMGPITFVNRNDGSGDTWWGGVAADSNGDWALLEYFLFTGSEGQPDGRVVTRVHKNGQTRISQNRTTTVYAGPGRRLRYFIEQNYFGNFGQLEDGVDNPLPKPQVREIYSDDSLVQIGLDAVDGWQRLELRDRIDIREASVRELQTWSTWSTSGIEFRLNTGGLAPGLHTLYLVVIDGLDAEGWDRISASYPIEVRVLPDVLYQNGFESP